MQEHKFWIQGIRHNVYTCVLRYVLPLHSGNCPSNTTPSIWSFQSGPAGRRAGGPALKSAEFHSGMKSKSHSHLGSHLHFSPVSQDKETGLSTKEVVFLWHSLISIWTQNKYPSFPRFYISCDLLGT